MTVHESALSLVVLAVLKARIESSDKATRKDTGMVRGDRAAVRHPLDPTIKLGSVTMTDPQPTARISNEQTFTDYMAREYPADCHQVERITGTDDEVRAVLAKHAPHLLSTVTEVQGYARAEVLRVSSAKGQPVGPSGELDVPGVEVTTANPVLQVTKTADAADAVTELWRSGRLNLDGTLRALPGSDTTAA